MVKSKPLWKKRGIWFILATLLSSALYFGVPIIWHNGMSDSVIYSANVDYFKGNVQTFNQYAISSPGFGARPLWPFMAWPLSYFISNYMALSFINVLLGLATVFILYALAAHLYGEKTGFLAGLLYAASLVPIAYSSRPLTEAGSYFFLILLIYYVEVRVKQYRFKELGWLSLLLALALLHKESALFLLLYLALDIGYRWNLSIAIKKGLAVVVSFGIALIPVFVWKCFTGTSWFRTRGDRINRETLTWAGIPALLFRSFITFHMGWLFAVYGIIKDKDKHRRVFYTKCFMALTPIILYAWLLAPPFSPRFAHFLFPLVIPAFAFGVQRFVKDRKLSSKWLWGIVLIYYLISYFGASLFPSSDVNKDTNLLQVVWEEVMRKF
ncbi:MAG: glycosyltransferase family 39 protein [Nanoarchaeota archaeon]